MSANRTLPTTTWKLLLGANHPPRASSPLATSGNSLNLRLDDALFQRLVESRWDAECSASDGSGNGHGHGNDNDKGVDFDGFARIYQGAATPATTFGRHLRKAAGRGEEPLGEL